MAHDTLIESLREWSQDDLHAVKSVRFYEPTFRNPAEIRAAVRELLAAHDDLVAHRDSHVWANERLAAQAEWRSVPEIVKALDALDDYTSMISQAYAHSRAELPYELGKVMQLASSVSLRVRSQYRVTSGTGE